MQGRSLSSTIAIQDAPELYDQILREKKLNINYYAAVVEIAGGVVILMLRYCELDTLAMVRLAPFLEGHAR